MKLRLTQAGFERYGGQMGVLDFVDGLSTTDVEPGRAARLAAVMLCEWENGHNPGIAQAILDNADTAAPVYSGAGDGSDHDKAAGRTLAAAPAGSSPDALKVPILEAPKVSSYTLAQLEAIADKKGMRGLRDIADPRGIRGNSIRELIDAIAKAG